MTSWKQSLLKRWDDSSQRPVLLLMRLFSGRIFKGGGELGADELDLGITVVLIFLAMPGTLVSLAMFEKYGSLIRFLRGDGSFDPFTATIPDEYFFIVLSMSISCAVALWRWNSIFPDRRDYANLVHLPVPLSSIFFANLFAVASLAGLLTFVVNLSSFVLFPIAVLGSEGSFSRVFRFAFGHAVSVYLRPGRLVDGATPHRTIPKDLALRSLCRHALLVGFVRHLSYCLFLPFSRFLSQSFPLCQSSSYLVPRHHGDALG